MLGISIDISGNALQTIATVIGGGFVLWVGWLLGGKKKLSSEVQVADATVNKLKAEASGVVVESALELVGDLKAEVERLQEQVKIIPELREEVRRLSAEVHAYRIELARHGIPLPELS